MPVGKKQMLDGLVSTHYWISQWKGINRKQSTRWQHLSRLKASKFFSLQKFFSYETQQLILGTGTAIWWVTELHWMYKCFILVHAVLSS